MWLIYYKDFQPDNELDLNTVQEYYEAAQKVSRTFIPAYLPCDVEAYIMRATSTERTQTTTTELARLDTVRPQEQAANFFSLGVHMKIFTSIQQV